MGRRWEDFLQDASFEGVTFDVISTRDEFGAELDVQEFAGRNGGLVDGRGQVPDRFQLVCPFFEDTYPDRMFELIAKVRQAKVGELVHPVWGTMRAAVQVAEVVHDAEDAEDAAMVTLRCVRELDEPFRETGTLPARAGAVRSAADQAQASASALYTLLSADGSTPATQQQGALDAQSAASSASNTATTLEDGAASLSIVDVQAAVSGVISKIDKAQAAIADFTTPEHHDCVRDLIAAAAALRALGALIIEQRPPIVEVRVAVEQPLLLWVHGRHATLGISEDELEERLDQVMALNAIPDPLKVPVGTVLRDYAL